MDVGLGVAEDGVVQEADALLLVRAQVTAEVGVDRDGALGRDAGGVQKVGTG